MTETLLERFQKLVEEGTKLTPLGGFDFSGYNARMQDKYLAWRRSCLESLELVGPIGVPYKNKIMGDPNGGLFYQSSASIALSSVRELFEKLKSSPELAAWSASTAPASPAAPAQEPVAPQPQATTGVRVLKPPPKPASAPVASGPPPPQPAAPVKAAAPASPVASVGRKKAFVIGEINDPLRQQLSMFLEEIGIEEIPLDRVRGEMLELDSLPESPEASFAFFVFTSEDLAYAMFELGHFVGALGRGHVIVLHMADVPVPKGIPGVVIKPIVVKLEEASLSIMKELKAAGYVLSL